MNAQPAHSDDDGAYLNRVKDELGTFTPAQDAEILEAIREAAEAVLELARRVASNPGVQSKPAVFLASLRRADHKARRRPKRSNASTARERAEALYGAKLRELQSRRVAWSDREMRQHALEYAVDYSGAQGPARLELEDELRLELDAQRSEQELDFEVDTPHRRRMRERAESELELTAEQSLRLDQGWGPSELERRLPNGASGQRYCRRGADCLISVAGHGAALSRLNDTGDLCLPCHQARRATRRAGA